MTVLTSKTFSESGKKPVEPCTVPIDPSAAHAEPVKVRIEQCGTQTEPCSRIPTPTYQPKSSHTKQTILLLSAVAILTMTLFPVVVIRLAYLTRIVDGLHTSTATSTDAVTTHNGLEGSLSGLEKTIDPVAELARTRDDLVARLDIDHTHSLATATGLSTAAAVAATSLSDRAAEAQIGTHRQQIERTDFRPARVAVAVESDEDQPRKVLLKRLLAPSQ